MDTAFHRTVKQNLAAAVSSSRYRLNISQANLAYALGISVIHLKNIESGRKVPSFRLLVALMRALEISMDNIVLGTVHDPLYMHGLTPDQADSIRELVRTTRLAEEKNQDLHRQSRQTDAGL